MRGIADDHSWMKELEKVAKRDSLAQWAYKTIKRLDARAENLGQVWVVTKFDGQGDRVVYISSTSQGSKEYIEAHEKFLLYPYTLEGRMVQVDEPYPTWPTRELMWAVYQNEKLADFCATEVEAKEYLMNPGRRIVPVITEKFQDSYVVIKELVP